MDHPNGGWWGLISLNQAPDVMGRRAGRPDSNLPGAPRRR